MSGILVASADKGVLTVRCTSQAPGGEQDQDRICETCPCHHDERRARGLTLLCLMDSGTARPYKPCPVKKGDTVRWADRTWVVQVVEGQRAVLRTRAGGQYYFRIVPLAALSHRKEETPHED